MLKLIKAAGIAALAGVVALAAVGPASAQPFGWGWGWGPAYHPYYRHYYRPYYPGWGYYYDPGAAIVGGIVGGVAGAITGAVANSTVGSGHVWRCSHAYRSYVPATNTYTGYDGRHYACTL